MMRQRSLVTQMHSAEIGSCSLVMLARSAGSRERLLVLQNAFRLARERLLVSHQVFPVIREQAVVLHREPAATRNRSRMARPPVGVMRERLRAQATGRGAAARLFR
jgi:hypothetical protein